MNRIGGWCWFIKNNKNLPKRDKAGKWMHFSDNEDRMIEICKKAISEDVCAICKCTDMKLRKCDTGVICFYINGDNYEGHCKVIQFMMDNGLIKKTKGGRYYNISYKFDEQTRENMYGQNFHPQIKLSDFIDLETGKWIK